MGMEIVIELHEKFGGSDLFRDEKDDFFKISIGHIYQTLGGTDLYTWADKKAVMLLYLITKNHSLSDINKGIADMMRKNLTFCRNLVNLQFNLGIIMFRQKIYNIINKDNKGIWLSRFYDWYMLIIIITSIVPLMFVKVYPAFRAMEWVTVIAFIIDYCLRWLTSNLQLNKGWMSYIIYPFTPMAIIDLLSILPGLNLISPEFKLLRLPRLLKIIRLLKIFRYSDKISMFIRVLKKERQVLLSVLMLALLYIFITALIMFNAEPHINPETGTETFRSFFDALYWATVTLTTVGYGDLCPVTDLGRMVSMLSSLFGVAIIALPSGVITASYLEELREYRKNNCHKPKELRN